MLIHLITLQAFLATPALSNFRLPLANAHPWVLLLMLSIVETWPRAGNHTLLHHSRLAQVLDAWVLTCSHGRAHGSETGLVTLCSDRWGRLLLRFGHVIIRLDQQQKHPSQDQDALDYFLCRPDA